MSDKQKTERDLEIPVPKRGEFSKNLRKVLDQFKD